MKKLNQAKKTSEYRNYDYWYCRIFRKYDKARADGERLLIRFTLGYSKNGDMNKEIYAWVKSIRILPNGMNTDLKTPKPVIEINFELATRCPDCKHYLDGKCLAYESSCLKCVDITECSFKKLKREENANR